MGRSFFFFFHLIQTPDGIKFLFDHIESSISAIKQNPTLIFAPFWRDCKASIGEKMECCICLEPLIEDEDADFPRKENSATACGHVFHHKCILDWLPNDPSCPSCRKPVHVNQLLKVHLEDGKKLKNCPNCPEKQESVDSLTETNELLKAQFMTLEEKKRDSDRQIKKLNSDIAAHRNGKDAQIAWLTEASQADKDELNWLRDEVKARDKKLHDLEMHYEKLLGMKEDEPEKPVANLKRQRKTKEQKKCDDGDGGTNSSSDSDPETKKSREDDEDQDQAEEKETKNECNII